MDYGLLKKNKSACKDYFFFQAEDGIRDYKVTGVQTCALPILAHDRNIDLHVCSVGRAPSSSDGKDRAKTFAKTERTSGKAAHTIPTIRVADITMPCKAAQNLAARP